MSRRTHERLVVAGSFLFGASVVFEQWTAAALLLSTVVTLCLYGQAEGGGR